MYKSTRGFTIVELLIVIVVIGILAAISIVAFNGIQTKAKVTQQVAAVSAYAKSFTQYTIQNGQSPYQPTADNQIACVYPSTACYGGWHAGQSTSLQTNMQSLLPTTPTFNERVGVDRAASQGGVYMFVRFATDLSECPSISGLTYISMDPVEAGQTHCRYGINTST